MAFFPSATAAAPDTEETLPPPAGDTGVLIVDDSRACRGLLVELVQRHGYRPVAVAVAGPAEALMVLASDPSIAVVFSDLCLPYPEAGVAFIRTLRRNFAGVPVVAASGFLQELAPLSEADAPDVVVYKPVRSEQVQRALRLTYVLRTYPKQAGVTS